MKIHERLKRGKKVWTVDGRINGKRQRSNFETKRAAEAYLKTIDKGPELTAWWAGLTLTDKFDLKAAFDIAKEDGFTLLAAAQNQAVSGRGKTHLKKMTLAEAIGYSGIDRRWKNDPNAKTIIIIIKRLIYGSFSESKFKKNASEVTLNKAFTASINNKL